MTILKKTVYFLFSILFGIWVVFRWTTEPIICVCLNILEYFSHCSWQVLLLISYFHQFDVRNRNATPPKCTILRQIIQVLYYNFLKFNTATLRVISVNRSVQKTVRSMKVSNGSRYVTFNHKTSCHVFFDFAWLSARDFILLIITSLLPSLVPHIFSILLENCCCRRQRRQNDIDNRE